MRNVHSIACLTLVVVAVVACGGSSEDDALFGAPGAPAGAGGGSAGKAAAGSPGAGSAGKAASGSGGATAGNAGNAGAAGGKAGNAGAAGAAAGNAGGAGSTGGSAGAAGGKAGAAGAAGAAGGKAGAAGAAGGKAGAAGAAGAAGGKAGAAGAAAGQAGAAGAAAGQAGAAGAAAGQAGSAGAAAGQAGSAGAAAGQAGSAGAAAGQAGAAGAGGAPGCVGDKTACTTGAGANGLCVGGVCSDCAAPADDQACRTAYPGADLCAGGLCEACDKPGATLVVDPVNGSDARGSGAATAGGVAAPGCALRTVTAAIKLVNAGPGGVTTIQIVGPSTLDAGESYPLVLPADVVLTTTGDVTAKPGPSLSGSNSAVVRLQHPGSAIDTDATFVIDASGSPASSQLAGVVVEPGSTDSTRLRGVSVLDAPGNGIRLTGKARLTVQDGVTVSGAGRGGNFSGIFLTDGGSLLTIDVPAGERPTTVVGSGSSGITVTGPSGVKISGVPGANPGEGTVVLSGNTVHGFNGLATGNGQQGVSLDGLVTFNNGDASSKGGSGVFLSMNTRAKVRRCVSLGNTRAGVHVDGTGALNSPATSLVDLGVAGDPGLNVLQDAASANQGVGICFTPPTSVVTSTQVARGNTFGAAKDCATAAASLSKGANCDGPHDVSVVSASASVTLDVAMCTIP